MRIYFFIFFSLLSYQSIAQSSSDSIVLTGIYTGRNVYVQNPLADVVNKIYCTDSVVVNGIKCTSDLNASAYEIDLKSIVKDVLGTDLTIIIYHKKNCRPKALVSMSFPQPRSKVEFIACEIDTTGHIHFTTRNTPTENRIPFILEQFRGNEWRIIKAIPQKWRLENTYDIIVRLTAGLNKFRISEIGYTDSGIVITVNSGIPDITCSVDVSMNCITCCDSTYFEIQTSEGIKLDSGYRKHLDISELKNGSYILFYENKRLEFDIRHSKKKKITCCK